MISLVAYDSEISDSDDDGQLASAVSNDGQNTEKPKEELTLAFDADNIFKSLPLPKKISVKYNANEETEDEFLKKKEVPVELPKNVNTDMKERRKPAKIFLPSLSSFQDEADIAPVPKFQPSVKGTGLLSLLPQPKIAKISEEIKKKSASTFIPDALRKKTQAANSSVMVTKSKPDIKKPTSFIKYDSSEESDADENSEKAIDFFSLKDSSPPKEIISDYIDETNKISSGVESNSSYNAHSTQNFGSDPVIGEDNISTTDHSSYNSNMLYVQETAHQGSANMEIDNEVIRKLGGSRARRKGENMQIIDINQTEILPDPREWLTKALTEDNSKRTASSKRRGDEPTTQQRRKHQITYLAHQAKANEQELQNQWANNRLSKKQTQSKYGF